MSDKDQIKDLFSEKLGNFEAKVNPELWANVASQVGAASTGAAAAGGMSLLTKTIIGISGAAALTTGILLYTNTDSNTEPKEAPKQEITQVSPQTEQPTQEPTVVIDPVVNEENNNTPSVNNGPIIPVPNPTEPIQTEPQENPIPTEPDPIVQPKIDVVTTPNSGITQTSEEEGIAAIQEQRKKDSLEISQPHVAEEDEPTNQVDTSQEETNFVQAEEIEITFPNVFTPNNDGTNDTYHIETKNVDFKDFEFVVYNSRGEVVMMTKDVNFKWTALDPRTGMYLEKTVYPYVMIGETVDGVQYKKSGTITIE